MLFPNPSNAADSYTFKIPIPGFESVKFDGTTRPIAEFIQAVYKYAIGIVAILATVVIMIGGVVWITAAGDSGRIGEAKQYITGAMTGLVLALCSFMILQTVNPDLVTFKPIGVKTVDPIPSSLLSDDSCTSQFGTWIGVSNQHDENAAKINCNLICDNNYSELTEYSSGFKYCCKCAVSLTQNLTGNPDDIGCCAYFDLTSLNCSGPHTNVTRQWCNANIPNSNFQPGFSTTLTTCDCNLMNYK